MSCTKCKKREKYEEFKESTKFVENGTIIFVVIWSMLAIYGLYTLITKIG
jgi:hypothetical protein